MPHDGRHRPRDQRQLAIEREEPLRIEPEIRELADRPLQADAGVRKDRHGVVRAQEAVLVQLRGDAGDADQQALPGSEVLPEGDARLDLRERMADDRKVAHLLKFANVSEGVAARLLVTYHLATQRPMMGAFLDGLGIRHENGLIDTDDVPKPDAATLEKAAKAIVAGYPADDVRLYFETLTMQDPETWAGLDAFAPA